MRNVILTGIFACWLGAADAPYLGKWKMNIDRSDFGNTTLTYEQVAGGGMKATMDGLSYTFKTDGKDNMTPWGMTIAWTAAGADSWEITEKTNGKVTATGTVKLSADGKTLAMNVNRVKAGGGTSNDSMSFHRVSGGPGLAGKWQTRKMTSSSPETLSLSSKGGDALTISLGNEGAVCDARFDGKDYTAAGPVWPKGWTCTVARDGDRAIALTWKKDGKQMYKTNLSASPDGKTLTERGSATGVNEKFTIVYDKQ